MSGESTARFNEHKILECLGDMEVSYNGLFTDTTPDRAELSYWTERLKSMNRPYKLIEYTYRGATRYALFSKGFEERNENRNAPPTQGKYIPRYTLKRDRKAC